MDETGSAVDSNIDHSRDGNPMQQAGPPYPVPMEGGPGPIYQNLVHTHYETPIDQPVQRHERSESSQIDKNSMDSYGFNHVYANPTFSGYPEIPAPDYLIDDEGSRYPNHNRKHSSSSSSSKSSNSRAESITRRASSPTIHDAPTVTPSPDHGFHNVPLDVLPNECPRSDNTITVIAVPDDYSYWTFGIYSTIAFVSMVIIIMIISSLFYYGILVTSSE